MASFFFSAPTRTRTWNPLIKSQLLYQLSHGCILVYQILSLAASPWLHGTLNTMFTLFGRES